MKDLSVSQSYCICALNESGKLPALSVESPVCLLAGGLIDLLFAQIVAVGPDKKLSVIAELDEKNQSLSSLYTFIKESKPMKVGNLASEYAFTFSDKRIKQLLRDVGMSLAELGCVRLEDGGLFGKAPRFIPEAKAVDSVIQNIRAELLEEGTVSDSVIALVSLLEKSNQIKKYFSNYEKDQLKDRLKEIRNSASNKLVKEMIDTIDLLIAVIAATSSAH